MTGKVMWRAEYFAHGEDQAPERLVYINATNEDEAAEKARAELGSCARVDLVRVRTVIPRAN